MMASSCSLLRSVKNRSAVFSSTKVYTAVRNEASSRVDSAVEMMVASPAPPENMPSPRAPPPAQPARPMQELASMTPSAALSGL